MLDENYVQTLYETLRNWEQVTILLALELFQEVRTMHTMVGGVYPNTLFFG